MDNAGPYSALCALFWPFSAAALACQRRLSVLCTACRYYIWPGTLLCGLPTVSHASAIRFGKFRSTARSLAGWLTGKCTGRLPCCLAIRLPGTGDWGTCVQIGPRSWLSASAGSCDALELFAAGCRYTRYREERVTDHRSSAVNWLKDSPLLFLGGGIWEGVVTLIWSVNLPRTKTQ